MQYSFVELELDFKLSFIVFGLHGSIAINGFLEVPLNPLCVTGDPLLCRPKEFIFALGLLKESHWSAKCITDGDWFSHTMQIIQLFSHWPIFIHIWL